MAKITVGCYVKSTIKSAFLNLEDRYKVIAINNNELEITSDKWAHSRYYGNQYFKRIGHINLPDKENV